MAIPKNKEQISITLHEDVIKWATKKAASLYINRARFLSDLIIQEYLKDTKNNSNEK